MAENYTSYPQRQGFEENEENLFSELLFRYLPWWPLFVALILICAGAAWFYLRYTVPVYETSATLLIKDEKKGINESSLLQSLDLLGGKKIVENEIEVIHSRTLAREVARELNLYAPVMAKGHLVDRSAYTSSPVVVEAKDPDALRRSKEPMKLAFRPAANGVQMNGRAYAYGQWFASEWGELRFVANPAYKENPEQKEFYFTLAPLKDVTGSLLTRLNVQASSKMSTVLNLTFQDEVPRRGEDVVNRWIEKYNQAAIADKNLLAGNTLQFVEDRLKLVTGELQSVETDLAQYRTKNNIVDVSAQGKQFLEGVGLNDQKLAEVNIQLSALDQVEQYVVAKNGKGNIVPSTFGIGDVVLNQLLEKLYEAEMQFEKLKTTTAENEPVMIALQDQIKKLKPSILENIRSQRRSLEAGRSDLYAANARYSSILNSLPRKEKELLDISRQQAIKNGIYTFLLQKREETALAYASEVADSRLVDAADTGYVPVKPKVPLVYLISLVAAFAIGIGFVSIREVLNRNIMFSGEIEKFTRTPILGEVALDPSRKPLVIGDGHRSFVAEQIRQLRTSLGYLGINGRKKKVLVTSTIPGEGKSFIASNLGMSLALMGKKVVLLELDLRKPKLSNGFGLNYHAPGLSNYFIGEKEPEHIIRNTGAHENLFIISSGPIPPNPSELILNGRLAELYTYLEEHFDYIITDTSPISPVTDAYIISPLNDATLYVVRHGVTPKAYIRKLDEHLKTRPLHNLAIIFNGVKGRGFGRYGYGYGYGNGYGYGYAYGEEGKKKRKKKSKV